MAPLNVQRLAPIAGHHDHPPSAPVRHHLGHHGASENVVSPSPPPCLPLVSSNPSSLVPPTSSHFGNITILLWNPSAKVQHYCIPQNTATVVADVALRRKGAAAVPILSGNVGVMCWCEDGGCLPSRRSPIGAAMADAAAVALILSVIVKAGCVGCFRRRCSHFGATAAAVKAVARARRRGSRRFCWAVNGSVVVIAVPLAERLPSFARAGAFDQRLALTVMQVARIHLLSPTTLIAVLVMMLLLPPLLLSLLLLLLLLLLMLLIAFTRTVPLLLATPDTRPIGAHTTIRTAATTTTAPPGLSRHYSPKRLVLDFADGHRDLLISRHARTPPRRRS